MIAGQLNLFAEIEQMVNTIPEPTVEEFHLHTSTGEVPEEYAIKCFRSGTGFEDGKLRVINFYNRDLTSTRRINLLKDEYGIGGCWCSCHVKDGEAGYCGYDTFTDKRGISILWKEANSPEQKKGVISWSKVEKILKELITSNNYIA